MSTKIQSGNNTSGLQNVDINYNGKVNLPFTPISGTNNDGGDAAAGFAAVIAESDKGLVTGVRDMKALEVTSNFRTRVATDQLLFNEYFPGSTLNSSLWTAPVTTSTTSVSGNLLTLNNASSLATAAVARVQTYRYFPIMGTSPLYVNTQLQFSATPVANMVHEWGLFIASGTTAPTDGVYFTINAAAELRCIVNTNGTINQSPALNYNTLIGTNTARGFLIYIGADYVTFWIDNIKVFESNLTSVSALGIQTGSNELPITFRSYNANIVTGTAQLMKVSMSNVVLAETNTQKPWSHVLAGMGSMGYQGQTGQTLGTTALYSNSLAAGAGAIMTNTTAALGSGLGGQFSALPTLAAGTDGIMSSFQVPAGTATAPGKTLYITGVSISSSVTTVLVGNATPVIYAYSLAFGHNNVSLATTTSTTAKAPVRIAIGQESFAAAAALGVLGQGVQKVFNSPIVVYPGEFIQTVAKNIGAVTTTGVITFLVTFDCYFE